MREVLSAAEIHDQHMALLPARAVMSLFTAGCTGGNGGAATGGIGLQLLNIALGSQTNSASNATGGNGGSCW